MSEPIDLAATWAVLEEAVALGPEAAARSDDDFLEWRRRVREFSELCARKNLKSYIAVLGNAMLAKASNPRVDVCSLKAGDKSEGAYDARRPAEKVLVPASQSYKFSLGTTGPQPLNNQPFFRSYRIDSEMRVRAHAKPVLGALLKLLHEIQQYRKAEAVRALAAFIDVRREYFPKYTVAQGTLAVSDAEGLTTALNAFIEGRSEGGGRAQAAAGGLFDALYSAKRVRVGKRNEPDKQMPGDIGIRATDDESAPILRIFEVRDKNVPEHAAHAVVAKVAASGVARAGLIAVARDQEPLNVGALKRRARESGIDLDVFIGWKGLVNAVVFAAEARELPTVESAVSAVRERAILLELSEEAVQLWDALTLRPEEEEVSGNTEEP